MDLSLNDLNILHIACVSNCAFNGVCVVAPLHANHQGCYSNTAFLNINNEPIEASENQLFIEGAFSVDRLEREWCRPNLVVFHEAYRLPYLSISRHLKKEGIPYVIVPHGELSDRAQRKKALKKLVANTLLFNRFVGDALAVQFLSGSEMNATRFKATKILATNGIAIPGNKKERFSSNALRFVYIGRLDAYHKGIDLMLDAIASIADTLRRRNASFELYGPDYKGRFAHVNSLIADRELQDLVFLGPAISGQEKERVLLKSDVFLQTSRFEGMPMGILEALSYGLPCALTRGTTLGEFVEENGAGWSAKDDAGSISAMILDALNTGANELLLRSDAARMSVEDSFSWSTVALDAVQQYQALLQKTSR